MYTVDCSGWKPIFSRNPAEFIVWYWKTDLLIDLYSDSPSIYPLFRWLFCLAFHLFVCPSVLFVNFTSTWRIWHLVVFMMLSSLHRLSSSFKLTEIFLQQTVHCTMTIVVLCVFLHNMDPESRALRILHSTATSSVAGPESHYASHEENNIGFWKVFQSQTPCYHLYI